jgi:hypothetical protein
MKTIQNLLALSALCVGMVATLHAQDAAPPVSKGKVLLLRNERVIEGDIEKVGVQYRVKRGASETWVNADQVVQLCIDWNDLYEMKKKRVNLSDPDERLKLARWCVGNQLRPLALAEANAALAMRPDHAETKQMVSMLERTGNQKTPHPAAPAEKPVPPKQVVSVDLSTEATALFATRIQPILMNGCVHCHSTHKPSKFQLHQVNDGSRNTSMRNLATVMEHINPEQPSISPLLLKAASAHDPNNNAAPLRGGRQSVPYRLLENWVEVTMTNHPHLKLLAQAKAKETAAPAKLPATMTEAAPALPALNGAVEVSRTQPRQEVPELKMTGASKATPITPITPLLPNTTPAALPAAVVNQATGTVNPADPYDPEAFNQRNAAPKR